MRVCLFALCLFATAASAEDAHDRALPLPAADKSLERAAPWSHRELLGDALGHWLGVRDGRWEMFDEPLADDGGPVLAGTIKKNEALIQLRWHPGE